MAEADGAPDQQKPAKRGRGMVVGLVLALLSGGGAFYAVYSGLLFGADHGGHAAEEEAAEASPIPDVAFVPIERIVLPVGSSGSGRFLHFASEIEVLSEHEAEVLHLRPRVIDVLHTYLRALDAADLSDSTALVRLRAQMLRRVQIVLGEGRARDLLITEFVIN